MLEKFLTKTPEEFNQLKVAAPPLEQEPQRETYRYAMVCISLQRQTGRMLKRLLHPVGQVPPTRTA